MEARQVLNLGFGASRVVFGIVASAVPEVVGRTWVGEDADRPAMRTIFRALGLRDTALGAGMVDGALRKEAAPWLAVAALSDLGDFTATVLSRRRLDPRGVAVTAFLTGAATLTAAGLFALDIAASD
ncbi:MAG: hypothetical protein ACKOQ5_08015 [Solirubrobacterales bacterium]